MKKLIQIKPSKQTGYVQMVGGFIVTIIGLAVVIPSLSKTGGPIWFGILWTGAGLAGVIMGAINAFSDTGIPSEEIVTDSSMPGIGKSTEDRLRELEDLRRKGLISQDEYTQTRKRILEEH